MTATEELRRLLDERGVEWNATVGASGTIWTHWDAFNGHQVHAMDNEDGTVEIFGQWDLTPEQAVTATLGNGTCHVKAAKKIGDLFGFSLSCGHSMVNPFNDHPDYCPWCGRKVVGG